MNSGTGVPGGLGREHGGLAGDVDPDPARDHPPGAELDQPEDDVAGPDGPVHPAEPAGPVPVQPAEEPVERLARLPVPPPVQRHRRVLDEHQQRPGQPAATDRLERLDADGEADNPLVVPRVGEQVRHGYGAELAVSPRTAVVTSGWSGSSGASIRAIRAQ